MGIIRPPVDLAALNQARVGVVPPPVWPAQGAVSVINWSSYSVGTQVGSIPGWAQSGGTASFTVNATGGIDITSTADAIVMYDTGSPVYYVEAPLLTIGTGNFPICVCCKDVNNFIGLRINSPENRAELIQRVGGTFTTLLQPYSLTPANLVDTYRVEVRADNTVALYWENMLVGVATIPDALVGATKIGMQAHGATTTANMVGNWSIYLGPALRGNATVGGTGSWCWFAEPRAISANGKTWIGYTSPDIAHPSYGKVHVQQRDHATGAITDYVLVDYYNWGDDHSNPTILIRPDGRLVAFYIYHGDNLGIRYRISVNPYDASAWGAETLFAAPSSQITQTARSYPSPVMLSNESNKVYVFFRAGADISVVTSTDLATVAAPAADGAAQTAATWSTEQVWLPSPGNHAVKGMYHRIMNDGVSRIDFATSFASTSAADPYVDIRHMYYSGGKFYNTNGAELRLTSGMGNAVNTTFTATAGATTITVASSVGIVVGMPVLAPGYIDTGNVVASIAGNVITLKVQDGTTGFGNTVLANASGVSVTFLPYTFYTLTPIATAGAPDNLYSTWIWDITRDPSTGYIYVAFAQITDATNLVHQYWWARWDGLSWEKVAIPGAVSGMLPPVATTNQRNYSPGIALDPLNPGVVYVSIGNALGTACALYRYTTPDGGATWTRALVSPPSISGAAYAGKDFRPFVPRSRDRRCGVIWLRGTYDNYSWDATLGSYHSEIMSAPV